MEIVVQIILIALGAVLTALFAVMIWILKNVKENVDKLWQKFDEFPHLYVTQRICDIRHRKNLGSAGE